MPGDAQADAADVFAAVGFVPRGVAEGGTAAMFGWEDVPRRRVVNLHVVPYGGQLWRDWVLFRDRLRADDGVRDAYAALKVELARTWPADRKAYIAGKEAFVRRVLAGGG